MSTFHILNCVRINYIQNVYCTYGSSQRTQCHHSSCGSSNTSHHSSSLSQSYSCLQCSTHYSQLLHSPWPGVWESVLAWLGWAGFVPLQLHYYPNFPSLPTLKEIKKTKNYKRLEREMITLPKLSLRTCHSIPIRKSISTMRYHILLLPLAWQIDNRANVISVVCLVFWGLWIHENVTCHFSCRLS